MSSTTTPQRTKTGHVIKTPAMCECRTKTTEELERVGRRCPTCDWELAVCALCGMAEAELDKPCPGKKAEPA
jgi:hypothetical protein